MKNTDNFELNNLSFSDIKIGDSFSFREKIDGGMVDSFAKLTGDFSPLHIDDEYAKKSGFDGRVVHGMLMASFFSKLIGMLCPGEKALYLSQEAKFINTLPVDSEILVEGVVTAKFDSVNIIELKTTIYSLDKKKIVDGLAKVKVRN